MKKLHLLSALFTFTIASPVAMAYQTVVEDWSNRPVCTVNAPCSPINEGMLHGYSGLVVTVKLNEGESPALLDNIHIVIESKGQFYQFQTNGTWEAISIKGLMTSPALKTSFGRPPWESKDSRVLVRQFPLYEFYVVGTKVYVGARPSDAAGFLEGSIKEAFVVKSLAPNPSLQINK